MALVSILRLELQEIAIRGWRYFSYLLAALAAVFLAGALTARTPDVRVVLFSGSMEPEIRDSIATAIESIGGIVVLPRDALFDPRTMRLEGAGLAVYRQRDAVRVMVDATAPDQKQAGFLAPVILDAIDYHGAQTAIDAALSEGGDRFSRLSLLPQPERGTFVPRVIALLAIFAPFLIAFESYVRQAGSGNLQIQLAAQGRGLGWFVLAKFVVATCAGIATLALLLVGANAFFGISPKDGLWPVMLVYLVGCSISAALGLVAAMLAGPSRQLVGVLAAYFFALITFSGFVWPLAAAADFVQNAAYALPLRYPLAVIEKWLVAGQPPFADPAATSEPLAFASLAAVAFILLWLTTFRAQARL